MPPLAWFILICIVVAFIIYAYIASKVTAHRQRRKRQERLPDAPAPLLAGKTYNIQLSHGRTLKAATIVGLNVTEGEHTWETEHWLVAKAPDGRLFYLRPKDVRYVEDA